MSFGIEESRIIFDTSAQSRYDFITIYNEVDIALDPFPFTGITTTMNALTMGVPVIALLDGTRIVTSGSASLLKAAQLEELAANSIEDYIQKAVDLAFDENRIDTYKASLRTKLQASDLIAECYAKDLQDGIRYIWEDVCKSKQ
jgi:predicted O-linked N-acetylglucosamine transferase (SPINDLY family)